MGHIVDLATGETGAKKGAGMGPILGRRRGRWSGLGGERRTSGAMLRPCRLQYLVTRMVLMFGGLDGVDHKRGEKCEDWRVKVLPWSW